MSSSKQQQQTTTTNSNGSDAKQLREQQTLFQIVKKLHGSSSFDKNKNKKELVSTSNKKKLIRCDESNNPTHIEGSEKCNSYQAEYPPLPSSSSTSTAGSGSDHSVDSTKSKQNDKGPVAGSSAAKPRRSSPAPTTVVSAVAKVLASAPSSIVQPPANGESTALGKKPTGTEFASATLLPRSENVEAITIAATAKEKKAKANAAKQVTKSYVLKTRTRAKEKEATAKAAAKVDVRDKLRSQKNENKKRIQEASDRINKKPEPVIIFVPKGITKINQNEAKATTTSSKKKTTKKKKK